MRADYRFEFSDMAGDATLLYNLKNNREMDEPYLRLGDTVTLSCVSYPAPPVLQ
jgi:hypothetical protein